MRKVCVFCGSRMGNSDRHPQKARELAVQLVQRGIELVYGGGSVGLMGVLADAVLDAGGSVVGVIPRSLATKELMHTRLAELIVVETLHERKQVMGQRSEGFIALPGGFGTMDELFEVLSWGQLGEHQKPIGILNVDGYYQPMLAFVQSMIDSGFLKPKYRDLYVVDDEVDSLLDKMSRFKPRPVERWVAPEDT